MKNNKWIWILLMTAMFFLQGCSKLEVDTGEKILAPKNKLIPIKGTWEIERYKAFRNSEEIRNKAKGSMGEIAKFDDEFVQLGEEYYVNPQYKFKNVNARDYFLYTYNGDPKDLGIEKTNVEVISITSKDKPFYDVIVIGEDQLMLNIDDVFYYFKKISDEIIEKTGKELSEKMKGNSYQLRKIEPNLLRTGLLLGLSYYNEENSKDLPTYRTLWIASKNRILYPVGEIENLFVPRKSGFWMLGTKRENEDERIRDVLFAYPLEDVLIKVSPLREKIEKQDTLRKILFVGNDYISTEYGESSSFTTRGFDQLQVLPLDNVEENKEIKISEIEGENGKDVFFSSIQGRLSAIDKEKFDKLEEVPREGSFAMIRKNGHWILKGRINYKNPQEKGDYMDYNINMIPSKKLVNYDELYLSWNVIKEKVPDALDAYTSPNRDMALIVCKNAIYIYSIKHNILSDRPIGKIEIKKGESVVMAEWATGSYVEKWKDDFNKVVNNEYLKNN